MTGNCDCLYIFKCFWICICLAVALCSECNALAESLNGILVIVNLTVLVNCLNYACSKACPAPEIQRVWAVAVLYNSWAYVALNIVRPCGFPLVPFVHAEGVTRNGDCLYILEGLWICVSLTAVLCIKHNALALLCNGVFIVVHLTVLIYSLDCACSGGCPAPEIKRIWAVAVFNNSWAYVAVNIVRLCRFPLVPLVHAEGVSRNGDNINAFEGLFICVGSVACFGFQVYAFALLFSRIYIDSTFSLYAVVCGCCDFSLTCWFCRDDTAWLLYIGNLWIVRVVRNIICTLSAWQWAVKVKLLSYAENQQILIERHWGWSFLYCDLAGCSSSVIGDSSDSCAACTIRSDCTEHINGSNACIWWRIGFNAVIRFKVIDFTETEGNWAFVQLERICTLVCKAVVFCIVLSQRIWRTAHLEAWNLLCTIIVPIICKAECIIAY